MRLDVKRSTSSSYPEGERRYHNLLYIPFGSEYTGSSSLSPIEYIIYPIGLRKVLSHSSSFFLFFTKLKCRDHINKVQFISSSGTSTKIRRWLSTIYSCLPRNNYTFGKIRKSPIWCGTCRWFHTYISKHFLRWIRMNNVLFMCFNSKFKKNYEVFVVNSMNYST